MEGNLRRRPLHRVKPSLTTKEQNKTPADDHFDRTQAFRSISVARWLARTSDYLSYHADAFMAEIDM
ncbi:hypothetical protein ABHV46_01175 [Asaia sp. BMEF1]|uniref:hypothetical protein n=1 Tax=Asaia sp. BMEF1 TaxID=3155932 RepID=UPI003F677645